MFPYVIDPSTFPEWQQGVVRGAMNESPTRVGSRCTTVRKIGEKGMKITRFKGLGEMDAEQLWETTMDPSRRTLLQVRLEDVAEVVASAYLQLPAPHDQADGIVPADDAYSVLGLRPGAPLKVAEAAFRVLAAASKQESGFDSIEARL